MPVYSMQCRYLSKEDLGWVGGGDFIFLYPKDACRMAQERNPPLIHSLLPRICRRQYSLLSMCLIRYRGSEARTQRRVHVRPRLSY